MSDQGSQAVTSLGCRYLQSAFCLTAPTFVSRFTVKQNMAGRRIFSASLKDRHPHDRPFAGITLCVTGLSKESREQVKSATERMGGCYSPDLHPQCTHLIVQSLSSRKFEHALKHGLNKGLYAVTLAWLLNSEKLNERLDESLYRVEHALETAATSPEMFSKVITSSGTQSSCFPVRQEEGKLLNSAQPPTHSKLEMNKQKRLFLTGFRFYVDPDISSELKKKVHEAATQAGATFTDDWYLGCSVTHVLCEGTSLMKYVGYNTNLVSPWWLLKTIKEGSTQHLVQFSSDLARQLALTLDYAGSSSLVHFEGGSPVRTVRSLRGLVTDDVQVQIREREERVKSAKDGVRRRRGALLQPYRTLPHPVMPSSLLDTVCWSVTEPTSAARLYADKSMDTSVEIGPESKKSEQALALWDIREHGAFCDTSSSALLDAEAYARPMCTSEKLETLYTGVFITILFPIDRYHQMGLSSKTYFSEKGFTRQSLLDIVYAFYQEFLSDDEIQVAIHTDSKHADKLRMLYASKESVERGCVPMRRSDFLGSRRSFEGLKRTSRENTGQIYELLLGP